MIMLKTSLKCSKNFWKLDVRCPNYIIPVSNSIPYHHVKRITFPGMWLAGGKEKKNQVSGLHYKLSQEWQF